jgi:hypothetical protein
MPLQPLKLHIFSKYDATDLGGKTGVVFGREQASIVGQGAGLGRGRCTLIFNYQGAAEGKRRGTHR